MKAKVLNKKQLNTKVFQFDFGMIEPLELTFIPGQFVMVDVGNGVFRPYSIYSDYKNKKTFSLAISVGHEGLGADYFKNLNNGEEITFKGPFGSKILPGNIGDKLILVATGTGITHILSYLYQLEDMEYTGNIDLYWGLTEEKDIYLVEELEKFKKSLNFTYHMQYSTIQGRVDKLLESSEFKDKNTTYYLCGHPDMVSNMNKGLLVNGINAEKIHF